MNRFKDCKENPLINPVDWYNNFADWLNIFDDKKFYIINETCINNDQYNPKVKTFELINGLVKITGTNDFDLSSGMTITKFMLLTKIKFNGNYNSAISYVSYYLMKNESPYFRVGCDYFKLIKKRNILTGRYDHFVKSWKKEEINQDHPKDFIKFINKYDDFMIVPDNKNFQPIIENCYNIYSKFPHTPEKSTVSANEIPNTNILMKHVFGDQIELGFKYLKVLYEHPKRILPILVLVSEERGTGKTTFLDFIEAIFGENTVLISPSELIGDFNSGFAMKNIIIVDETTVGKSEGIERVKALATQKRISVNPKFVQQYTVPFYGTIIMASNKTEDFMKIDDEEIRYWIRKLPVILKENHNTAIDQELIKEIPKLLKYIEQLPEIDFSQSRMTFTKEEIETDQLLKVKKESKSGLYKELYLHFQEFFDTNEVNSFQATAQEIKDRFYRSDTKKELNYISHVLKKEFKLSPTPEPIRYSPFDIPSMPVSSKMGRPYTVENFIKTSQNQPETIFEMPF